MGEEESGMDLVSIFFFSSVWLGVVWKYTVVSGWIPTVDKYLMIWNIGIRVWEYVLVSTRSDASYIHTTMTVVVVVVSNYQLTIIAQATIVLRGRSPSPSHFPY